MSQINYCCIASSGGGGHNTAMLAIISRINLKLLREYQPVRYKIKLTSLVSLGIFFTAWLNYSAVMRALFARLALPVLPNLRSLLTAIDELTPQKPRHYIDMLLDVCKAGYECAAIWNIYQRHDQTKEIKKLVDLQAHFDQLNYHTIVAYFSALFQRALRDHVPYTHIISTQVIGMQALCDAVLDYKRRYHKTIVIQQYITDIPTPGAVHFFHALARLTAEQQQLIELYAVNLENRVLKIFFPQGQHFLAIHSLSRHNNPMVRTEFYAANTHYRQYLNQDVILPSSHHTPHWVVPVGQQIASILLGSQAGYNSVNYLDSLLGLANVALVFVFTGNNTGLQEQINVWRSSHPAWADRVISLGHQNDQAMVAFMMRSNIVIIRAGGLSVMEQMAMHHLSEQLLLIHHEDTDESYLTSGIPWEDGNADELIAYLHSQGIAAAKTCPRQASDRWNACITAK